MLKIFYIIISFIVFSVPILSQSESKLNTNFYNTWIEANYYEEIQTCKTPVKLKYDSNFKQIYFFKSSNIILFTTLREGIKREYKITHCDTIHIFAYNSNELMLYLLNDKNGTKLVLKNQNKITYFIALEKKYYLQNGVNYLLNDMFLAGEYVSESDSKMKVTFSFNGNVRGIGNFNKYSIPIHAIPLPSKFDIILLLEQDKKIKKSKILHWRKKNDKIVFYNVSDLIDLDGNYSESKILSKYLTLKKIK